MASFREQFEELFGAIPDYDPIDIDQSDEATNQRALNIQEDAPDTSDGILPYTPLDRKAIDPDQGVVGNLVDLTKTGTAMGAEAILGVAEYGARQAGRTVFGGAATDAVASGLESARGQLAAYRQSIYDMMPADAIQKKGAEFLTLDPDKTIWQGNPLDVGEAILYKFWESLPMMLGTLVPGAVMMRAGASAKGIAYLGASEGGLSVGFIANEITDGIQEMDDETLAAESPRFRELLNTVDSPEAARDQLIAEAQGLAPIIGGVLVGAISATAGRYLEPVIKKGAGVSRGTAAVRGAVSEGFVQEGPQESIETIAQNIAAAVYDGDRATLEGVAESYIQGAVVGMPGGAVVAGLAADGSSATDPDTTPADRDDPDAPSSFTDVFGEQVPPPGGYTGAPGDMFGDDPNIEVSDDQVDAAAAAAVSAAIREDNLMDDMIENIDSQTPEGRQQEHLDLRGGEAKSQFSDSTEIIAQQKDNLGRPIPTHPDLVQDFEEVMGPNDPGPQQPPPPGPPGPGTPMPTGAQQDMFGEVPQGQAPPLAAPEAPTGVTQGERGATPVDGWVATMTDNEGNIVEEEIFETIEEANQLADTWKRDLLGFGHEAQVADAFVNVTRSMGQRGRPRQAPLGQTPADQPTAEPLADIQAQLEDMAHEGTSREAVYLSADNLARLQRDGLMELIQTAGIAMENFDGKGGVLIVRDEEIAVGAREMLELGMPMQHVLGQLTRAGAGKPMGDTVVQVRDDAGRVIRETLVASEEEAFTLANQIGDSAVVLTSAQALKRREKLIAEEQVEIEARREAERQQQVIREELPMEERGEVEKAAGTGVRKSSGRAAASTLGLGIKKAQAEKTKAIGGFFPPDTLEFSNAQAESDYREAFGRLLDNQIAQEMAGTYPINRKTELKKEAKKLFEQIGKIRQVSKPTRKVTRVLKTAAKLDKGVASTTQRVLSKKQDEIDTSQQDYFAGQELERRTRDEIDALEGAELATAFAEAVYWLAGQFRNVKMTPEWLADNPQEAKDEAVQAIAESTGDPLDAVAAKYGVSPGQQKKLIRRVNIYARRKEYGGKIVARGVTSSATDKLETRASKPGKKQKSASKSEYDTGVLTRTTEKQDESRSDQLKREERSKKAKKELAAGVRQAARLIDRLENPDSNYGKVVNEKDIDGNPTEAGQNMLSAMGYYVSLTQFALSLIQSGQTSTESSVVMERLNKQLRDLIKLTPKTFANKVARLARANEQSDLKTIANLDVREQVTDPTRRMTSLMRYHQDLMTNVARRLRLHKRWKNNPFYNNHVGPLMNKFTGSIASDGWASYKPNEAELTFLKHAMNGWRTDPTTKKAFYDPMKQFFRGVGVTFDKHGDVVIPTDKDGKYQWSMSDEALEAKMAFKTRGETEASAEEARYGARRQTVDQFNKERQPRTVRGPRGEVTGVEVTPAEDAAAAALKADENVDNEQAAVLRKANNAINAFLKIVNNSKSTIDKLVKAEQRFIRRMKELNVWEDTSSPMIGRIVVGVARRYHKIGLRLLQKKISKQEARTIMGKMKPFIVPEGLKSRKFTVSQAEKELDLLLEMVGEERNHPELLRTAQQLGIKLSRRDIAPSMNAMLLTMLETLPENHVYRALAEKLLPLGIHDVRVQYDWDGDKIPDNNVAHFRVRTDEGRNIYLNKTRLQKERDLGGDMSVNVIHAMLHEMVHAATHRSLGLNPDLRLKVLRLRQLVADKWTGDLPYGLKEKLDADGNIIPDEFIAEAFTDLKFQEALKKIYVDGRPAWKRWLDIVKQAIGLDVNTPPSVMDTIMSLESELFAGSNLQVAAEGAVDLNMDMALRPAMSKILDSLDQGVGSMKNIWSGIKPPLIAMTMEQLRDTYQQYFGSSTGPMRKYMDAFFARNAENTRLMENAEKLTRKWTALNEEHGAEVGVEFSEIATDTTLAGVSMAPLSDPRNEHVKSPQMKAKHKELYSRYKKLPTKYRTLYNELRGFYRETLENEVGLLKHNALRGLLKKDMSVKEFESKYSVEKLKAFDTAEKFNAEFGQYLDDSMLKTLNQMTTVRQQRDGDYFPLKRYGDFVVYAEKEIERKVFDNAPDAHGYAAERRLDDRTLDVSVKEQENGSFRVKVLKKEFRMAETKTKAEQNRQEMVEDFGEKAVGPVDMKSTFTQDSAISSNAQLNRILEKLDGNPAAQAAIKNFYLESLSEQSFRKQEIKRKHRTGVERDLQLRNFTVYAKQSSYYTAQLKFGNKMAEGLAEMDGFIRNHRDESTITTVRMRQVLRELQKRDEMTVNLNEIAKFAKKSVEITQFMMLTSPSYWMINASQPWMVTLPWLTSKYGLGASLTAMKNAQKLIASDLINATAETKGGLSALWSKTKAEKAFNVLDDVLEGIKRRDPGNYKQYKEMLEELRQQGVIDLSWIAELRDISEGVDTGKWQKTLDASRVMAHLTEVNNRILTALATYELAKAAALKTGQIDAAVAHQVGIKEAKLAVSQTQFNYSSPNKPRLFQSGGPLGSPGPMVFQFMQWPQHMYALMIQNFSLMAGPDPVRRKEARKLLAGLFATHLAAGGVLGAALQPVKWAFGLLAMAFGDEGEDTLKGAISGETFDRATMRLFNAMFGSEIAGVLGKGLPTIIGGDLSQRMSLGTVYYLNFRGDNAESALGSLALGLGGASVNLAANFGRGVQHFFEGNYRRAIESASPKILRDIVRTTRMWDEGLVNRAGDTVIPSEGLTAWDLALQSMGVQPFVVSQFYEGQSAIKDKEIYFREKKSDILRDFRLAVGDSAATSRVMREVTSFNRVNPAIAITRSALVQSAYGKAERESRYRRYGANIDEKAATIFAEEADPYR